MQLKQYLDEKGTDLQEYLPQNGNKVGSLVF